SRTHLTGAPTLLLSAVIWGFAFVAQRAGMEFVGPFTFNGIRFALGALVLVPWILYLRTKESKPIQAAPTHHVGMAIGLAGLVLFASANLQQIGLVYTTAGKAGFITGLYVVIVPLLGLFLRHRVSRFVWIGCVLAAVGMYLLSVAGTLSLSLGDTLVLIGALGWAVHVHLVGWLALRMHPLRVAVLQFAICSVLSLAVALFTERIQWADILSAGWMIAYAGILSVGVAYTLQVVGQQRVDPARAGIILSLEAVFAVIGGWILLGETLSMRGLLGCALMLSGMMLAQVRVRRQRLPLSE
ncbi:DMT family transporter, partial [Candidatus Bipolaricaulota bacterium]|nr:DMT family transporter [Candidatus Bipolaricaulota bacterium]